MTGFPTTGNFAYRTDGDGERTLVSRERERERDGKVGKKGEKKGKKRWRKGRQTYARRMEKGSEVAVK